MSSPDVPRQGSRWGNLFHQAVAGVESRLDTILAADDEQLALPSTRPQNFKDDAIHSPTHEQNEIKGHSNGLIGDSRNERLQARLARAVGSNIYKTPGLESSLLDSGLSSRAASPLNAAEASNNCTGSNTCDLPEQEHQDVQTENHTGQDENRRSSDKMNHTGPYLPESAKFEITMREPIHSSILEETVRLPIPGKSQVSQGRYEMSDLHGEESHVHATSEIGIDPGIRIDALETSPEEYEAIISKLQKDHEMLIIKQQEDSVIYQERIDALQSKLQYLSKESAQAARRAADSASPGSLNRKLAESEERIALLLEEGQKLSKAEFRYLSTIKKLRAKIAEHEKQLAEEHAKLNLMEQKARDAAEKARRAETAEKNVFDKLKRSLTMEKVIEDLKSERTNALSALADARAQLMRSNAEIEQAENPENRETLRAEKETICQLREDLSRLRTDKEMDEQRLKTEIEQLTVQLQEQRSFFSTKELELRHEQSVLETKLEASRARAEEFSCNANGETQTSFYRQLETLQTQYVVASENWQRIEGSLLSRIRSLEEEKDHFSKRESELRRKAREGTLKLKQSEEKLEQVIARLQKLEQDTVELKEQADNSKSRAAEFEALATELQEKINEEQRVRDLEKSQQTEELKSELRRELQRNDETRLRFQSDLLHDQYTSISDKFSLTRRSLSRVASGESVPGLHDRSPSHRNLGMLPLSPHEGTRIFRGRQPSSSSQLIFSQKSEEGYPGLQTEHEDTAESISTHSSQQAGLDELVSVSTVGAGPSVQLVERMSAAVRRLESERAAQEEAMLRLSLQRDNAREEVVALMREVEQKRSAETRVAALELELSRINERYQTTLEMLGEKSEQVDELQADVADLKKIYRELIDSTMR